MKTTKALVGLTALLLTAGSALADHSCGNYRWERAANPLSLSLGENLSGSWSFYFDVSISDWDQVPELFVAKRPGTVTNLKTCELIGA